MTPHRPHRLARLLAAGMAAAALAAPAAQARIIDDPQLPIYRDGGPVAVEPVPIPSDARVVVRHIDAGFDWGSAAIGAGGAGALVVLVSFGGFAYASRDRIRVAR